MADMHMPLTILSHWLILLFAQGRTQILRYESDILFYIMIITKGQFAYTGFLEFIVKEVYGWNGFFFFC